MTDHAETDALTTAEAAKLLRVNRATLDKWRQRGHGPVFVRIGAGGKTSPIRYTRRAIADYLAGRPAGA
jgi:predicted site-specific integrase-resolvase